MNTYPVVKAPQVSHFQSEDAAWRTERGKRGNRIEEVR